MLSIADFISFHGIQSFVVVKWCNSVTVSESMSLVFVACLRAFQNIDEIRNVIVCLVVYD